MLFLKSLYVVMSCYKSDDFLQVWCDVKYDSLWSCHINVMTCCVLMSHHMSKCHVSFDKSCWEVPFHVMLPHVTKCHITPIPCHAVLICDMAVRHTNSFEDYELRLPTTFKGSFPSHPPLSPTLPPPHC